MAEGHAGFRAGRGRPTVDQLLVIRKLLSEKYFGRIRTLYNFIDFTQAFDSVATGCVAGTEE